MRFFKYTFLVFVFFVISSCSTDPNTLVDIPKPPTEILAFIDAKVNGVQIETNIPSAGVPNYQATISYLQHDAMNGDCENYNYEAGILPISNTSLPAFKVGFIRFLDEATQMCSDELSVFESLFKVEAYDFSATAQEHGVNIKHINGGFTYSSYGPQDTSANFNITGVEVKDCGNRKCVNVLGTFNVRLYNVNDFTDFIDVTEGSFKVRVQSFN